jgi:hypothetical protein
MKWLFTSKKSGQEIYELRNGEEKLLALAFHSGSGSLRITSDGEKRVFLIGREGFLRSRTVLRNEYGVRIGQLNYEGGQDNLGTIDFDNERLNYAIHKHLHLDLLIQKNGETLVTCELPAISRNNFDANHDLLILALCWYMFAIVKRQAEEYA